MPTLRHNSFREAVDRGAQLVGSQNKLAKRLGTNSGNLANAKAGRAVLSLKQLEALATLVDDSVEHLWTLQQLARLPHRNPTRRK